MRRGQEGKRQNGREKHLSRGSQLVLIYTGHQAVTKQNPILISSVRYQNKVHEKPFTSTIKRYGEQFLLLKKKIILFKWKFWKRKKETVYEITGRDQMEYMDRRRVKCCSHRGFLAFLEDCFPA